ncbi:MAG: ComEC/Rec2 family competence protein [Sarcina sp.]
MKKFKLHAILLATITSVSLLLSGCGSSAKTIESVTGNIDKPAIESTTQPEETKNEAVTPTTLETEVHFIDTGNSDSILIKGEKTVLIDGGDNNDETPLVEYIKKLGITKIDYLIATHNHADHIGGLDSVVKNLDIGTTLVSNGDSDTATYKDFINALGNKKLSPSVPLEGVKFDLGTNSYIQLFNGNGGLDTNEQSLVTLYVNGNDKFLFTGDAEAETEKEILDKMPDVDVLKVGHHGSKSSTTQEFLDKVKPEIAVITVGKDNKYNHPHKVVMDRIQNSNIKVHRTDECGSIIFKSTGNGVKTDCKEGTYKYGDKEVVAGNQTAETATSTTENNTSSAIDKKPTTNESQTSKPETTPESTVTKPKPTIPTDNQGKIVWLSATGSKYHSKNNCGRMNPDNARQVTIEEAKSQGMEDCSKC